MNKVKYCVIVCVRTAVCKSRKVFLGICQQVSYFSTWFANYILEMWFQIAFFFIFNFFFKFFCAELPTWNSVNLTLCIYYCWCFAKFMNNCKMEIAWRGGDGVQMREAVVCFVFRTKECHLTIAQHSMTNASFIIPSCTWGRYSLVQISVIHRLHDVCRKKKGTWQKDAECSGKKFERIPKF